MITKESILTLRFFDYNEAFTGSYHNLRFRIIKVEHEIEEDKKEAKLAASAWPGPYAYDYTDDKLKENQEFEFSEAGKEQLVDWLNELYETKFE